MVGGVAFLHRQTEAGGAIFANMIVIQSVKKRQTEVLTSMYRKEPITSTSIIFTTKIKKFVLMHKQNQEESASDESLKKFPNCVAKLVKLENSPCIIILAFKDISKYVELLFDYGDRLNASILADPLLCGCHSK
jgi:hypothetical protein